MGQHIRSESVKSEIHAPKFTHKFTLGSQIHETVKFIPILYEIRMNSVRISREFAPLSTVSLSHGSQSLSLPLFVATSHETLSQLAFSCSHAPILLPTPWRSTKPSPLPTNKWRRYVRWMM